jgi:hypothetical protein
MLRLSSIKNNTKMLKKLYSKLLFVAKLTSATLTHTNGETIVRRTPTCCPPERYVISTYRRLPPG